MFVVADHHFGLAMHSQFCQSRCGGENIMVKMSWTTPNVLVNRQSIFFEQFSIINGQSCISDLHVHWDFRIYVSNTWSTFVKQIKSTRSSQIRCSKFVNSRTSILIGLILSIYNTTAAISHASDLHLYSI